MLKMSVI